MSNKIKLVCSYCGAVILQETHNFADTLFMAASFGCSACHVSGRIDDFLMHNAETELAPSLYYGLTPYGLDDSGTFHFMIGSPKILGRPFH